MRLSFRSLLGQLSGILLVTSLSVGAVTSLLFLRSFLGFADLLEQLVHEDAARAIVRELESVSGADVHQARVLETLRRIVRINPNYDLYLLDQSGRIAANSPLRVIPDRNRIELGPVREWISRAPGPHPLLLGDDPTTKSGSVVFVASPLTVRGAPGYLYVALKGSRYRYAASVFGETKVYWSAAAGVLAAALLLALSGVALVTLVLRRLSRMTAHLLAYASGNYAERIPDDRDDELGIHARAFNTMADRIEQAVSQLRRSEETRRELVANVSHDLRTPLAAAHGLIESVLVNYHALEESERRELLTSASGGLLQLGRLISDLFELSKLEARASEPVHESFSASELAQDVAAKIRGLAKAREIELDTDIPHEAAMVRGDIGMIERLLTNLLANAVDHTPPGGRITVSVTSGADSVRFSVRDTGTGIPAEDLPRIFERFYRGADESSGRQHSGGKRSGGAGLGLAIAKRIAELHSTTLSVESVLHAGSTFSFSLPIAT